MQKGLSSARRREAPPPPARSGGACPDWAARRTCGRRTTVSGQLKPCQRMRQRGAPASPGMVVSQRQRGYADPPQNPRILSRETIIRWAIAFPNRPGGWWTQALDSMVRTPMGPCDVPMRHELSCAVSWKGCAQNFESAQAAASSETEQFWPSVDARVVGLHFRWDFQRAPL
jgi:hypothetical protein